MEVPMEVLHKLLCENCEGYLSRGPILRIGSSKYRCGRCLTVEGEEKGIRVEVYEELAKLMAFPCRYKENGCQQTVPFENNGEHEDACQFREMLCPIAESGKCEWTGIQTELLKHCRDEHPQNEVQNPFKFTHNITRPSLNNYLLWAYEVMFLIQTKVCVTSKKIYHSVRLIGDPICADNYNYRLDIQNGTRIFSKDRQVASRGCLALQHDTSMVTGINSLLEMLGDYQNTTFTLTVQLTGKEMKTLPTTGPGSQGTTSLRKLNQQMKICDTKVVCGVCFITTEPIYRRGWLCEKHAPASRPCKFTEQGCTHIDLAEKCTKHEYYYCAYSTYCRLCHTIIMTQSLNSHYIQHHSDITHTAGTLSTDIRVTDQPQWILMNWDLGNMIVCTCKLSNSYFMLDVRTPLASQQLYEYRCVVEIRHPDTGHTLACTAELYYGWRADWYLALPVSEFNKYTRNGKVNIKIDIYNILDGSHL